MNHIYRLVWNARLAKLVVVHEKSHSRGRAASGDRTNLGSCLLGALMMGLPLGTSWAAPPGATTLPNGYNVTAGSANISSQGSTMTVQQTTGRTAIDWQNFSIGSNARVNFQQPNASAIALNRVVGNETSVIDGALQANGQVFLLNSNGLLFTRNAQVNVGGLVASTLDISNTDFMAGKTTFSRQGEVSSIVNQGNITAKDGGYIALLGSQVRNEGVITARLGAAVMAAGDKVSLNFNDRSLVSVSVDQGALQALVDNQNAIVADGGLVVLTAKGLDQVLASAVNNSGEVRAHTIDQKEGRIYLLGDMQSGATHVAGTLDASAPDGGNGGFIETSAAHIKVADSTRITTTALHGLNGSWLVDPQDLTIAASGGDITGSTISNNLANGHVTLVSSQGSGSGSGNINVNDSIHWNANTLTLTAANNINVNAVMTASGAASLNLNPGTANTTGGHTDAAVSSGTVLMGLSAAGTTNAATGNTFTGQINFSGSGALAINGTSYTVINSLGLPGSITGTDLQGMNGNLAGHYVLGSNIEASATATWIACSTCNNGGAGYFGFTPIANVIGGTYFTGVFDGLGHSIKNLNINGDSSNGGTGLFGLTGYQNASNNYIFRNIGIVGGSIAGRDSVGALAGVIDVGNVANSYVTANVSGLSNVGGLIGSFSGPATITNSFSTGSVAGIADSLNIASTVNIGGLIGYTQTSVLIDNSYAQAGVTVSAAATGSSSFGGLVGYLNQSTVRDSHATGSVSGGKFTGGLVGYSALGTINNSYASGNVTSTGDNVGGLVGYGYGIIINNSYASGNVTSTGNSVGGLVGYFFGTINRSYAIGQVFGSSNVGGLLGSNYGGSPALINDSYATGSVTGASAVGGLVGLSTVDLTVERSYASGSVNATGLNAGGLVGQNQGVINNSLATGAVSSSGSYGGLLGYNSGTLSNNVYTQPTLNGIGTNTTSAPNPSQVPLSTLQTRAFIAGTLGWDIAGDNLVVAYPTLRWTANSPPAGNSVWVMVGNTPSVTTVNYTLGTPSGTHIYSGSDYLSTTWSPATIFGNSYSNWQLGTDYSFQYNGNSIASLKNVGTYNGISVQILKSGFALASTGNTDGNLTITAKPLTVTGTTVANKVYDGNTTASLSGGALYGVVGNDSVTLAQTGSFANKNVGTGKTVMVTDTLGGSDAGNYSLTQPTGLSASITAKPLTVMGTNVTGKTYDGSTQITAIPGTLNGLVGSEMVGVSASGQLDGPGVGARVVRVAYSLQNGSNGGLASNYSVLDEQLSTTVQPNSILEYVSGNSVNLISATNGLSGSDTSTWIAPSAKVAFVGSMSSAAAPVSSAIGTNQMLIASPASNESSQLVTLTQARNISSNNGSEAGTSAVGDVRIPVSRTSLAEIVNGGVSLPVGVEQHLFAVQK